MLADELEAEGRTFTIYSLSYFNGIVDYIAGHGKATVQELFDKRDELLKSGAALHVNWIRNLARFAEIFGLVEVLGSEVRITELGGQYAKSARTDRWTLSKDQVRILKGVVTNDEIKNRTLLAIRKLKGLTESGAKGEELVTRFCDEIGKSSKWTSPVSRRDFLRFNLNYLKELGLIDDPKQYMPAGAYVPDMDGVFVKGGIYRREDIHRKFGGQSQYGISTPRSSSLILLFASPSGEAHGYTDGWAQTGAYYYTGEGQEGDMKFTRGNKAVLNHSQDGRDLHLFQRNEEWDYVYIGQMICTGYEIKGIPGEGGTRKAIVFELFPVESFHDLKL